MFLTIFLDQELTIAVRMATNLLEKLTEHVRMTANGLESHQDAFVSECVVVNHTVLIVLHCNRHFICTISFQTVIKCQHLEPPTYGKVHSTDYTVGSVAEYKCDYGYRLVGQSTRSCQYDEQWSGQEPVCEGEVLHFNESFNETCDNLLQLSLAHNCTNLNMVRSM